MTKNVSEVIVDAGQVNAANLRPKETAVVIERAVEFNALVKGRPGHMKPLDKSRAARLIGRVIYRRHTTYAENEAGDVEMQDELVMRTYVASSDRPFSHWADKLNPLRMFCTKVPIMGPEGRDVLYVVDYDKLAYWAERVLKIACGECGGSGRSRQDQTLKCYLCAGRRTLPLRTADTLGKLRYEAQLQERARLEKKREVEWFGTGLHDADGNEVMLSMPAQREAIVIEVPKGTSMCEVCAKEHSPFIVETRAIQEPTFKPRQPSVKDGDLIIADWDTAKALIEQMRAVEVRAGRGLPKQRPFYGMDALFERLYHDNEDSIQGIALRGNPQQFVAPGQLTVRAEHKWRSQVEAAIAERYMATMNLKTKELQARLATALKIEEQRAAEAVVVDSLPVLAENERVDVKGVAPVLVQVS